VLELDDVFMKNYTKKTLGYFLSAISEHKLITFVIVLSVIGASVIDAIIPIYFKNFFNYLVQDSDKNVIYASLITTIIIIAIFKIVQWALWRIASFSSNHAQSKVIADLSNQCFAYMHKHSFSFFSNSFVGSLVKRVKWFTGAYETIVDNAIWNLLPMAVTIISIIIILFRVNIYLSLGVLAWTVVFLTINWFFTNFKLKYDIERNEIETKSTGLLADTITNNSNVKLFNGYKREVDDFSNVSNELRKIRRFTWNLSDVFEGVQGLLMTALEIGIFFAAIWFWKQGKLTIGDFVLIQTFLLDIFMRVWNFGKIIRNVYEKLSDAEEMTIMLETPHDINDIPNAKNLIIKEGKIEFKKVDFNYNETRSILKDFNLTIEPHQRAAIIGASGSGKTTIVKLIFRMHDLTAGKLLIDGQDISKVTQESLWQNISLVPQDPILFHRTLLDNIRYGKPDASDDEVIEAAKAAHCHEFISEQTEGYNTFVGERGIKLSGGERQRIAIARAILRNAPILVLDEATSSLDSESEHLIQDALAKLMENKTVIVIAHRLSTIRQMDRIVVIEKGKIVEDGDHNKLLEFKEGIYHKLWQFQAGGFIK